VIVVASELQLLAKLSNAFLHETDQLNKRRACNEPAARSRVASSS